MPINPDTVLDWLRKGGYPIEYEVARQLRGAGFSVEQGRHYPDTIEAGKSRDVDVLALFRHAESDRTVNVMPVVECKAARGKAWVVLTTDAAEPGPWEPVATPTLAYALGEMPQLLPLALPLSRPYGYSVIEARDPDQSDQKRDRPRDLAHNALEQVMSAAVGIVQGQGDDETLMIPIVVTEAQLFRLTITEPGKEDLSAVDWYRVRWHGAQTFQKPTSIDVVNRQFLSEYGQLMKEAAVQAALACLRARREAPPQVFAAWA